MHSLATICRLNDEVTAEAQKAQREPHICSPEELEDMPPFPFPNLGNYEPEGWEPLAEQIWFVDSTGFGAPDEPALTVEQFKRGAIEFLLANPGQRVGFAIIETGPMQLHVQAFCEIYGSAQNCNNRTVKESIRC